MTNDLLSANVSRDTEADANEWRELEKERAALGWEYGKAVACGVKHPDKPHPDSYRPDLPLRAADSWMVAGCDKLTRTSKQERAEYAQRPLHLAPLRADSWHDSFRMSGPAAIERAHKRFAELSIVPSV